MGQFLFIILCVTLGYVAYKHAGAVRSDGSALCRKNCDECTRKCWIMKKTEDQKWYARKRVRIFYEKSRELPFMLNHNISWKFIFFIYCIGIFHSIPIKKSCDMLPFRQKFTGHIKPYKVSNDLFQTFSALQHKKRNLDFSRFLQCGWWDSNPRKNA